MPARRGALVEELISLFLAEGFLAFGVGDLAARLRCSRTTLYAVAPSKEQIVTTAVRAFFRRSTERIDVRLEHVSDPAERLRTYLDAIADELAPASPQFFADVDAFEPARELYARNTEWAARRVHRLVADLDPSGGDVDPAFVGFVAAQVMLAIQRGELEAQTGFDDATAYHQLATLLVSRAQPSTAPPAQPA